MSEPYSLPTEPEGVAASLLERFSSGKVSMMMALYEPEAVLITKDGRTITGHTGIAAELKSAKGKVTKGQEEWLELLRRVGFRTFVWRPADWLKIVEVAT